MNSSSSHDWFFVKKDLYLVITQNLIFPGFMKSAGFHGRIQQISHEIWQISADFMKFGGFQWISWNPPENLINQITQRKLFSFMECSGKAMSQDFMKSAEFTWNLLNFMDFTKDQYVRNGKAYVYVGTTDILRSTFSFDSVKIFSHLYRPPTTTPPLYHRYELDVRGEVVVGGCMWQKYSPHHHPTPAI